MKFFTPNEDEVEDGMLSEAVDNYQAELNEGNYKLYDELCWTGQDEMTFIMNRLEKLSHKIHFEQWDLASLKKMIEKGLPVGLGRIVHLLSVVYLLENQQEVRLEEELQQLEDRGALCVAAGMPGPCLVYLNALKGDPSIEPIIKHSLIESLIYDLTKAQNTFGILSHLVLRMAITDWFNLFDHCTPLMKERLTPQIEEYQNLLKDLLPLPIIQERMTGVEECILLCLQQFKNDIGQIHVPELNDSRLHPALP